MIYFGIVCLNFNIFMGEHNGNFSRSSLVKSNMKFNSKCTIFIDGFWPV